MDTSAVRIVLVAPAGPLNVGSVARVMKNFGLNQLALVNPQCDPLGSEAMQMAVHAKDVLQNARRVNTIPEALEGCHFAIATTARQRGFNAPLEAPEAVLPALLQTASDSSHTALIFGPEDRGLSNEELTYAQKFTKIPTDKTYSALNLAQAVAVCCYELYRASEVGSQAPDGQLRAAPQNTAISTKAAGAISKENLSKTLRDSPLSDTQTESTPAHLPTASIGELEGYYEHLERVLLEVEYLYSHTAPSRMRKLRQLLNRAQPTSQEVAMLRGMLRQTEWALSNSEQSESDDSSAEPTSTD